MYQQGLGDCFLLSFPKPGGKHAHVMIDCGVVLGTSEPATVMKKVAENLKAATNGKVDVLVITHEHWDHLSGFDEGQARNVFATIQFDTLWLAWTEDETNPVARQLREERERKKKAVKAAREEAKKRGLTDSAARMAGLLGFFGAAAAGDDEEEGGGTAGALAFLKKKCSPTIVQTGGKPSSIPGIDGIRVYVLGPPMDGDLLKKTNPYKGEGYGLGGAGAAIALTDAFQAAFDSSDERGQPFLKTLRKPMSELKERLSDAQKQAAAAKTKSPEKAGIDWYEDATNKWRNIDDAWLAVGERLALHLDNATNNTSLVLAFEFNDTKEVLLFVGDAQAGNWRSWDSREWTVKEKDGEQRKVTAADLLQNTIFYKVGHHGSHNATLREKGLERMTNRRLAAVIPVDTDVAHTVKGWENMPLPAIQDRLKEKCSVVFQSDKQPQEIKDGPDVCWEQSGEKFDVRMTDKKTKKVETVRKQCLYTDFFL